METELNGRGGEAGWEGRSSREGVVVVRGRGGAGSRSVIVRGEPVLERLEGCLLFFSEVSEVA